MKTLATEVFIASPSHPIEASRESETDMPVIDSSYLGATVRMYRGTTRWLMSRNGLTTRAVALAVAAMAGAALMLAHVSAEAGLAPAFTLELLDGTTLSLADYRGSPVILLFWAPW